MIRALFIEGGVNVGLSCEDNMWSFSSFCVFLFKIKHSWNVEDKFHAFHPLKLKAAWQKQINWVTATRCLTALPTASLSLADPSLLSLTSVSHYSINVSI